jgi:hypothetical protein
MATTERRWSAVPIDDRNLAAGTRLIGRYKGKEYRALVVEPAPRLRVALEDGRFFTSVSAAASAVIGGGAVNGWRFWSVDETTGNGRGGARRRRRRGPPPPEKAPPEPPPPPEKAPPEPPRRDPFVVIGVPGDAAFERVRAAYRRLAKRLHPDAGGSHAAMVELNDAYETIRRLHGL